MSDNAIDEAAIIMARRTRRIDGLGGAGSLNSMITSFTEIWLRAHGLTSPYPNGSMPPDFGWHLRVLLLPFLGYTCS